MGVVRFVNVFAAGIGGGGLWTIWIAVTPAKHRLPDREAAQNHVETSKFIDYFMPPSMVISGLSALVALIAEDHIASVSKTWLGVGLACSIAVGVISVAVNFPLNAKIEAAWKENSLGGARDMFQRWARAHAVRTLFGLAAFGCYTISLIVR